MSENGFLKPSWVANLPHPIPRDILVFGNSCVATTYSNVFPNKLLEAWVEKVQIPLIVDVEKENNLSVSREKVIARLRAFMKEIKKQMDEDAHTRLLQATDEVMNSAEMAEIAKQQALVDLQNSYNEQQSDSAEHVGSLAASAVDI